MKQEPQQQAPPVSTFKPFVPSAPTQEPEQNYNDPYQSNNDTYDPLSYNNDQDQSISQEPSPVVAPAAPQPLPQAPKEEAQKPKPAPKEEPKNTKPSPKKQEKPKEEESGGWSFFGFLKKKKATVVDLSKQDNKMYYDEKLGRYVMEGQEVEEHAPLPPPPQMATIPANTNQPRAAGTPPPMAGVQPKARRASSRYIAVT